MEFQWLSLAGQQTSTIPLWLTHRHKAPFTYPLNTPYSCHILWQVLQLLNIEHTTF